MVSLLPVPLLADPISELFDRDGTEEFLQEIAPTLEGTLRAQFGAEADEAYDAARLMGRFSANRLRVRMLERLGTSWRIEEGEKVEAWFRSDLGRTLRNAERALAGAEAQRLMGAYVATYSQLDAQDERAALAQRILAARRDVERLELVYRTAIRLSLETLDRARPASERYAPGEMEAELESALEELRPELRQRALWRVLFTHRSVPLSDLQKHVEFVESSAGLWYYRAVGQALERALNEAVNEYLAPPASED